jgi:hypothetical protein
MQTGANKANWTNYPQNMLFAWCISNIAKFHCADAFGGSPVYLPDEIPNSGLEVDGDTLEVRPSPAREVIDAEVIDNGTETPAWTEAHGELVRLAEELRLTQDDFVKTFGVANVQACPATPSGVAWSFSRNDSSIKRRFRRWR